VQNWDAWSTDTDWNCESLERARKLSGGGRIATRLRLLLAFYRWYRHLISNRNLFSAKAMNSPAAFEIDGLKYFRWKRCAIQLIYPIWLKNKRCSKSALNVDSKESIGTGCKIVVSGLRDHDDDIVDRNGEEHISFVRYEYAWVKFARCESQDRESCHKVRGTRFVMLAWGDITIWRGQSQMCAIVECCLR